MKTGVATRKKALTSSYLHKRRESNVGVFPKEFEEEESSTLASVPASSTPLKKRVF